MKSILNYIFILLKQIWLGGTPNQTSLAKTFMNKVKLQDLEKVFEPLFYHWKRKRQSKESFGDFSNRLVSVDLHIFIVIFLFKKDNMFFLLHFLLYSQ